MSIDRTAFEKCVKVLSSHSASLKRYAGETVYGYLVAWLEDEETEYTSLEEVVTGLLRCAHFSAAVRGTTWGYFQQLELDKLDPNSNDEDLPQDREKWKKFLPECLAAIHEVEVVLEKRLYELGGEEYAASRRPKTFARFAPSQQLTVYALKQLKAIEGSTWHLSQKVDSAVQLTARRCKNIVDGIDAVYDDVHQKIDNMLNSQDSIQLPYVQEVLMEIKNEIDDALKKYGEMAKATSENVTSLLREHQAEMMQLRAAILPREASAEESKLVNDVNNAETVVVDPTSTDEEKFEAVQQVQPAFSALARQAWVNELDAIETRIVRLEQGRANANNGPQPDTARLRMVRSYKDAFIERVLQYLPFSAFSAAFRRPRF